MSLPRALASALLLALLAPAAPAEDAPERGVVLLVRDAAWPYAADAEAALRVDGAPVPREEIRGRAVEALAASAPIALDVVATRHDGAVHLAVGAAAHADLPGTTLVLRGAVVRNAVVLAEASAPLPEARRDARAEAAMTLPLADPAARVAVWVQVGDDSTGRFATGQVLQATSVAPDASATQRAKGVLVEARSPAGCAACAANEAAARDLASELAHATDASPRLGYARVPDLPRVVLALGVALLVGLVLVPRGRSP